VAIGQSSIPTDLASIHRGRASTTHNLRRAQPEPFFHTEWRAVLLASLDRRCGLATNVLTERRPRWIGASTLGSPSMLLSYCRPPPCGIVVPSASSPTPWYQEPNSRDRKGVGSSLGTHRNGRIA
jgi:hypothetical protein